tara:strand:- start:4581 stop:6914 length:2334 start_codon:yes stop_codon:yes gene_type:complete
MVLPFIAAGVTEFLNEGKRQKDLYANRQQELAVEDKKLEGQKRLVDYKANLERSKAATKNAEYNQSLFGVNYNTTGMTTFPQKAQAAVTAVSSDPEGAISYLKSLKDSGNNKLYQQEMARFKNMYQTYQKDIAKLSGTERGVAGVPDMVRALPGLLKFMSAEGLGDLGGFLKGQNAAFEQTVTQAIREKQANALRKKARDKSPAVQAAVERFIESGVSLKDTPPDELISGYSTKLNQPLLPPGTQSSNAGKQLGSFYSKSSQNWQTDDFNAVGTHFRVGFTVGQAERLKGIGAQKHDKEVSRAYDASFRLFNSEKPLTRRGQYALADPALEEQLAHRNLMKDPAIRDSIKRKQDIYNTMKRVSAPLIQIADLIGDKNVNVGFAGLVEKFRGGASAQVNYMLGMIGIGGSKTKREDGESDAEFETRKKDRGLLYNTLNESLRDVKRLEGKDVLTADEKQSLISSLGNLSAFLLARYVQEDDNKISNDDVKQMKKNIGIDDWIASKGQVRAKLNYFIKDAQKIMMRLEGYSTARKPNASSKNYQHAQLWERMMEESGGVNVNTGKVILTPQAQLARDKQIEQTAITGKVFGKIPGDVPVTFSDKEAFSVITQVAGNLNIPRSEISLERGVLPTGAFEFNDVLTKQVRSAAAQKAQVSTNMYVTSVEFGNNVKQALFKLNLVDGKLIPVFKEAYDTPEELLRGMGVTPSAKPNGQNVVSENRTAKKVIPPATNNTAAIEQQKQDIKNKIQRNKNRAIRDPSIERELLSLENQLKQLQGQQ